MAFLYLSVLLSRTFWLFLRIKCTLKAHECIITENTEIFNIYRMEMLSKLLNKGSNIGSNMYGVQRTVQKQGILIWQGCILMGFFL